MKKLVSLALAAAMTFMLTSVNPVPNFAQDSINLDKPLLMQFNDKLNKDTVYKDIRFLDEKGNEIPVLINLKSDKEAIVFPLYDMKDIKVSLDSKHKQYKASAYEGETVVGDASNLKRLSEMSQRQNMVMYDMMPAAKEESVMSMDMGNGAGEGDSYSSTNVQVEGVDEADIVKTDGEYIYYLKDNQVVIIKADKNNMKKMATIGYLESALYPSDIYIDENLLMVVGNAYNAKGSFTKAVIYDVTDKSKPVVKRVLEQEGYYVSSRKNGDNLHIISSHYVYDYGEGNLVPKVKDSAVSSEYKEVQPSKIMIYPGYPSQSIIVISSADIKKNEPSKIASFMGNADNIYMSKNSLYLTYQESPYYIMPMVEPKIAPDVSRPMIWPPIPRETQTTIKKFAINNTLITYSAQNKIQGYVLNQFSMDEHNDYFRIAYTSDFSMENKGSSIAVFDKNMNKAGSIDNIAPGERIYSARFMGDRAYMVTFRNVDPFFVMDLKDPKNPKMLGYLKIPGYSDYLHPYDENHIIGFGKDTVEIKGNPYQLGMKISLFDVTDVNNPVEKDIEKIGDRGTESELLHNHKALMYDKSRGLMGFPISVAKVKPDQKQDQWGFPQYGEQVFQGAYIYNVSADKGIDLKGSITHIEEYNPYMYSYEDNIQRIIYIGDTIYTLSNNKVVATNLNTMKKISELDL